MLKKLLKLSRKTKNFDKLLTTEMDFADAIQSMAKMVS